jgi:hypothetical protein
MGAEIMENSCRSLENLHYLDSWNKHCGGSWWQLFSRSFMIGDSLLLAYASSRLMWAGRFFGLSIGSTLFTKSMNDLYEGITGEPGPIRDAVGDTPYTIAGYATIGYGLFSKVPKRTYLGTPKRDLFVRDPLSYEYAFRQYSRFEFVHLGFSTAVSVMMTLFVLIILHRMNSRYCL